MKSKEIEITASGKKYKVPIHSVHTIVLGSGAAGLNSALQLHNKEVKDLLIVTEGLDMGTSINTGSDKQTYYKLGMSGEEADSPVKLAKTFFAGGSMHGDLAMVEAALSPRAFFHLVNIGVDFPRDTYGQFCGYKTDHDPLERATSVGPYTSKEMCVSLIREITRKGIPVMENRVAVKLLVKDTESGKRVYGFITINDKKKDPLGAFEIFLCENLIFATGGPGGIYKTSVYPTKHTGAIGLALMEGAEAQNLPESQYGLASTKFRWNVSGTYMQVIPRFVSLDESEQGEPIEFLAPWFKSVGEMNSMVFLKGYQWPFDPKKLLNGSSIIDLLVYIETVIKKRRVYLDFRSNPNGFDFQALSPETLTYLTKSNALQSTPLERLAKMNPIAIELYKNNKIDLSTDLLEIAVCAQHNNGGLAADKWWHSTNIAHLFPVGEVNGSHGVYRPGGSALNSGQVAGFRAAEYISAMFGESTQNYDELSDLAQKSFHEIATWISQSEKSETKWQTVRTEFQERMTESGSHIRSLESTASALTCAKKQYNDLISKGNKFTTVKGLSEAMRNIQLCFAHLTYLDSLKYAIESGVGSRGSAMVLDKKGESAHPQLEEKWNYLKENDSFKQKVLITQKNGNDFKHEFIPRKEIPCEETWFENIWANYREKKIYQ